LQIAHQNFLVPPDHVVHDSYDTATSRHGHGGNKSEYTALMTSPLLLKGDNDVDEDKYKRKSATELLFRDGIHQSVLLIKFLLYFPLTISYWLNRYSPIPTVYALHIL
jgi:hypothetical protein